MSVTHEALARENFVLSAKALTPEWRVTMLFYAAVHAANHVFFGAGYAPNTFVHANRDGRVSTDPKLKVVNNDYRELSTLSRTSRYLPDAHPMSVSKVNRAFTLAVRVLQAAGISTLVTPAPQPQPSTGAGLLIAGSAASASSLSTAGSMKVPSAPPGSPGP